MRRTGQAPRPRPTRASCCSSTDATPRRSPLRAGPGKKPKAPATTSPIGRRRRRENGKSRPEKSAINLVARASRDKFMSAIGLSAQSPVDKPLALASGNGLVGYLTYLGPTTLLTIGCLIHAVVTHRYYPWIFIILFLPGIGGLVYLGVE